MPPRPLDKDSNPLLSKQDAIAIVRVLLPRIAPNEKMKDYDGMGKCVRWLGGLSGRGTTWEDELKEVAKEHREAFVATNTPLF